MLSPIKLPLSPTFLTLGVALRIIAIIFIMLSETNICLFRYILLWLRKEPSLVNVVES